MMGSGLRSVTREADWRPWVRPMVRLRRRCHRELRRWRDSCLARPWGGYRHGKPPYKHKPKGLRLWLSLRYPDGRVRS